MKDPFDEIAQIDTEKLHAESLQLRNQQFQLGTIALAGSGLTAWVAPGLTAVTAGNIPELALLGATFSWLMLLFVLFLWSLALRRLIVIISEYIDIVGSSRWEPRFRALSKIEKSETYPNGSPYQSQTLFIGIAFIVYGLVASAGSLLASMSEPTKIILSVPGKILLLSVFLLYVGGVCSLLKTTRTRDSKIRGDWVNYLQQTEATNNPINPSGGKGVS